MEEVFRWTFNLGEKRSERSSVSIRMQLMAAVVFVNVKVLGDSRSGGPFPPQGCFHPPDPCAIPRTTLIRDEAKALFPLHGSHHLCEKLAAGCATPRLLAIHLCIDSLLKAIDFQPAACVHM